MLALAAPVAQADPSVTALTGGSLFTSDFTMIAAQSVRAAAQIVANATAAVLTGYHTLGCKRIAHLDSGFQEWIQAHLQYSQCSP